MQRHRTQIYLDRRQRERVARLAENDHRSLSEVVREALDRYLDVAEQARRPLSQAAPGTVGAWAGLSADEDEKIRSALHAGRAEAENRAKRLGY